MSAENLKIIGNSMNAWKNSVNAAKNAGADKSSSVDRKKATRMDTFEISNRESYVSDSQGQVALSPEIKDEKASIIKELSQNHVDVNRFLEIKAQVRAGTYEINQKDVADSLMPYLDFNVKA